MHRWGSRDRNFNLSFWETLFNPQQLSSSWKRPWDKDLDAKGVFLRGPQEVSTGESVEKWEREGKKANMECINEQDAFVGSWGSVLFGVLQETVSNASQSCPTWGSWRIPPLSSFTGWEPSGRAVEWPSETAECRDGEGHRWIVSSLCYNIRSWSLLSHREQRILTINHFGYFLNIGR